MTKLIRLNKYLSDSGICSRRKADEHICCGDVYINNKKASVGEKINPNIDKVFFKSKIVENDQKKIYLALYKPVGIVSTLKSQKNEKNLLSLINVKERVYPIGRLDKDSEGLMILTNDGNLTKKLTHPKYEHQKEYQVFAEDESGKLSNDKLINKFEKGIKINHVNMKVDKVFDIEISGKRAKFKLIMHTGFNRQIRRMSAIINLRVTRIIRTRLSNLKLENLNLKPGQSREISIKDIL